MDTEINRRGFWKKVNRGGLMLLVLAVAAVVFLTAMLIEGSRIEKIAAKAIEEYNEALPAEEINGGESAKKRNYYDYDVSYESLDRIIVQAEYLDKFTVSHDYYELERSGGSWKVVFCRTGSTDAYGTYTYEAYSPALNYGPCAGR